MKKILLFSLFLFNASLVDAMANLATMLKASAALRRNLQMADVVDVTVEHRDDGTTFVHYIRNGQEMAVFNADLLKNSGTISDMFSDLGSSDDNLVGIVKRLFDGLSIEQIKLAVQALDLNNSNEEAIKEFIEQLGVANLGWLANWTNEWALENVSNALISKIASDKSLAFDIYSRGLINNGVAQDVTDKFDFDIDYFYQIILRKLGHNITSQLILQPKEHISSTEFSSDGQQILVATDKKVMIYDLKNQLWRHIISNNRPGEDISSAKFSPDGLHILVKKRSSVEVYDLEGILIKSIKIPLGRERGWIALVAYSPDGSQILVETDKALVFIYDLHGNLIGSIASYLQEDEYSKSVGYSPNGKLILIGTTQKVMIYDLQGNLITMIIPQLPQKYGRQEIIESVIFNPKGSEILIETDTRLMIYDLQGNLIRLIIPKLQRYGNAYEIMRKVAYNLEGSQIIITMSNKEKRIYDLEGNLIKITPQKLPTRSPFDDIYSPDRSHFLREEIGNIFFLYPNVNLEQLDLGQKALILKAYEAWKTDNPYILSDDELETYNSLPKALKNKKLFEIEWSDAGLL